MKKRTRRRFEALRASAIRQLGELQQITKAERQTLQKQYRSLDDELATLTFFDSLILSDDGNNSTRAPRNSPAKDARK